MTDEEKAKQMLQWAMQPDPGISLNESSSELEEISGYEIEKILGQGGMGAVYKARHRELGRVVAIKLFSVAGSQQLDENSDLFLERLKKEGRMMAQLEHPNVLGIHDASATEDGTPYLILEYVEGMDLFQRMQNAETLSEKEAIRVASAVCNGLDAVHGIGIVHRDIKPANILMGNDGSIKVSDFGISKDVEDSGGTQLTLTGTTVGTVDYMSPEHAAGKELDARADVYSVGVMLYEMIAGVTPRGAFEPLSKCGASKPMEKLVMRCLQRDREQRIGSARELADELAKVRQKLMQRGIAPWKQALLGAGAGGAVLALLAMALKGKSDSKDIAGSETSAPDFTENSSSRGGESPVLTSNTKDGNGPGSGDGKIDHAMFNPSHWEGMELVVNQFKPNLGVRRDGGSLVSSSDGIDKVFSKMEPGDSYVFQLKWKRYTGDNSIGVILPTKYGSTIFEMGAWDANLVGLQAYQKDGRLITMNQLTAGSEMVANRPLNYKLKNAHYHYVRIHVNGDKVAILMKPSDQANYRKVGFYNLAGKRWKIPPIWKIRSSKKIGLASYKSQFYASDIQFKRLK